MEFVHQREFVIHAIYARNLFFANPLAAVHLQVGSAPGDGPARPTSEICKWATLGPTTAL